MKKNEIKHNNLEDEMLLTNTKNKLYTIAIYDILHLKVLLDKLDVTFEGIYFYNFEDIEGNFISVKKLYQSLSEEEKQQKGITKNLIQYKACAYYLYQKVKDIEIINTKTSKEIAQINDVLNYTLVMFKVETINCDMQNETLYKMLYSILYSNMKKAKLITEEELEKLVNKN